MLVMNNAVVAHIPKTGGTSLIKGMARLKRGHALDMGEHKPPSGNVTHERIVYGMMRHPYDLAKSWYNFGKEGNAITSWEPAAMATFTENFSEYCEMLINYCYLEKYYNDFVPVIDVWGRTERLWGDFNEFLKITGNFPVRPQDQVRLNVARKDHVGAADESLREGMEETHPFIMFGMTKTASGLWVRTASLDKFKRLGLL